MHIIWQKIANADEVGKPVNKFYAGAEVIPALINETAEDKILTSLGERYEQEYRRKNSSHNWCEQRFG